MSYRLLKQKKVCYILFYSSQFHDGIHLKILPALIKVFLRYFTYCRRKAFYEDEYDKINEPANFKCNLASHINKIRDIGDTGIKLGSKGSFFF